MPNGIDLILADHQRVNELFGRFDESGEATLIGEVVDALMAHDDAEQAALYPLAGYVLDDAAMIERYGQAHSLVKKLVEQLLAQEGQPLLDTFVMLRETVTAHVADEESELLPALVNAATPEQLDGLGARIEQVKQRVG